MICTKCGFPILIPSGCVCTLIEREQQALEKAYERSLEMLTDFLDDLTLARWRGDETWV